MAILGKFLRVGTKLGVVGGACYYSVQAGLWADPAQTEQLYKELYKNAAPYLKHTVVEVPELPKVTDLTKVISKTWNSSVIASTDFLMDLPSHLSSFAAEGYEKINELLKLVRDFGLLSASFTSAMGDQVVSIECTCNDMQSVYRYVTYIALREWEGVLFIEAG